MKYKDFNSVDVDNLAKQYGYSYTPIVDAKNINEDGLYCNPMSKTIKHDVLSFSVDGVYCELFTAQFQVVL